MVANGITYSFANIPNALANSCLHLQKQVMTTKKQTTILIFKFMISNLEGGSQCCLAIILHVPSQLIFQHRSYQTTSTCLCTLSFLLLIMDERSLFLLKANLPTYMLDPIPSNFKLLFS